MSVEEGRVVSTIGGRYGLALVAAAAAGLSASALATVGMLSAFEWASESETFPGSGWAIGLAIARALLIPVMLVLVIRMTRSAIRISRRDHKVVPRTANTAILYYSVTAAYISLGMFIPIFWVVVPVLIEPILYPLAAVFLLVATVRAIRLDGNLPGDPLLSPQKAALVIAAGLAIVFGASVGYAYFASSADLGECILGQCSLSRTLGVIGLMAFTAVPVATMAIWGLHSTVQMARRAVIGVLGFACLALLFPIAVLPAFILPYNAFVPAFFYGAAAFLFLLAVIARKDAPDDI